jgi:hypothetical protein
LRWNTIRLLDRWQHFRTDFVEWITGFKPGKWKSWQLAVQIGLPLLLAVAFWRAARKRKRRLAQASL